MATAEAFLPRELREPAPESMRAESARNDKNVGELERWLCVLGGSAMTIYGASRRSIGGAGLALAGGSLIYRGLTGHCPVYGTLGISTAQHHGPATSVDAGAGVKVVHAVTINKPADELYRFWRNLENLPQVMTHLHSVNKIDERRSHWVACAPMGFRVEWNAEIHNEDPNRLIAWRSLPGSQVDTAGSVLFAAAPGGRGTEVKVTLKYDPPAGKAGVLIARLFGEAPEQQIREDLQRFMQMMEMGAALAK